MSAAAMCGRSTPIWCRPPRTGAERDRAKGLAGRDLGSQDRVAILLGIGAQRAAVVDDRHAERLELLFARDRERLVENATGLGKRQCHRVSPCWRQCRSRIA
jgi:hypothetical protein